jgi:hypothetical protein
MLAGMNDNGNSTRLDRAIAREGAVWQALVDGDAAADAAALADEFLGVYTDGFSDKEGHVAQLAHGPTIARFAIETARFIDLGPDHYLLAYRARYARPGGADEVMYVSSLWRQLDGQWRNIFSQDTPVAMP